MAKLGSGGSRGPAQGMLPVVLLLLLLASVQAVPAMAEWEDQLVGVGEKVVVAALGKIKGWEGFAKGVKWGIKTNKMVHKAEGLIKTVNPGPGGGTATLLYAVDTVELSGFAPAGGGGAGPSSVLPVLTADITATIPVRTGFCAAQSITNNWLRSIKLYAYGRPGSLLTPRPLTTFLHRCPGGGAVAVLGLGSGGDLSRSFTAFSYLVTSDASTLLLLPTPTAASQQQPPVAAVGRPAIPLLVNPKYPNDGRYYVAVAGIRVGGEVVQTPTELGFRPDGTGGVYLSTTDPYTYLESGVHFRLKVELIIQIEKLNPGATSSSYVDHAGKLCYVRVGTELTLPLMEIIFANSNAVMKLGVANVWYREEPSTVCLAILPSNFPGGVSILGSWLQSGRIMTIHPSSSAGSLAAGTLTF